jgi:hypothetical protein
MISGETDIERIVLMNACEDYALLWQILGEVRQLRPNESEDAALEATRRSVEDLLRRDWLAVYRRQSRASAFVLLQSPEREAALASDAYWRADPIDTVEIGVAATASGETAYRAAAGSPSSRP